jgi:hypothetical protein
LRCVGAGVNADEPVRFAACHEIGGIFQRGRLSGAAAVLRCENGRNFELSKGAEIGDFLPPVVVLGRRRTTDSFFPSKIVLV